jgi:hypothetical protein
MSSIWTRRGGTLAVTGALWLVLAPRATAGAPDVGPDDDGVPSGTVAFFSFDDTGGNCPAGWAPATQVQGRMIVGVNEPDQVGTLVGTPLTDQEDRTHIHAYASVLQLPNRQVPAGTGGSGPGARNGDHPFSGETENASSGLPFVQLLVCEKS